MNLDAEMKKEKKYSRYGMWLFSGLIVLQCIAYFYDQVMGNRPNFSYFSLFINLVAIFCFKYTYSLVYLFKLLNKLEEREVKKAVHERLKKQQVQADKNA